MKHIRLLSLTTISLFAFGVLLLTPAVTMASNGEDEMQAEVEAGQEVEVHGDGIDNDHDGKTDEVNRGKHPEYEMEDADDEDRFGELVRSFRGKKKGKVQVTFADGSKFEYKVFSNSTAEQETPMAQLKNSGSFVAVRGNGKTVAIVNPYTGKKITTAKLSLSRSYGKHSIKQYDLLQDGSSEIVVVSRNEKTITHITVLRYDETMKKLTVLSRKSMSGVKADPKRTTFDNNQIMIKSKNSTVLTTVTVNPDYTLQ